MSISTATFSQWFDALEKVFLAEGITLQSIDKTIVRERYYDKNCTPYEAYTDIIDVIKCAKLYRLKLQELKQSSANQKFLIK